MFNCQVLACTWLLCWLWPDCLLEPELILEMGDNVTVWQCDSLTVWQLDSVTVWQCDSLTVWQCDSVTVWQSDSVTVWQSDSVTVWHGDWLPVCSSPRHSLTRWHRPVWGQSPNQPAPRCTWTGLVGSNLAGRAYFKDCEETFIVFFQWFHELFS